MRGRHWSRKYIPGYARNPLKLAWQLLNERNPAARSALFMAVAGFGLTPLDLLLSCKERRIYLQAPIPKYPILLVCGPPRSGTTLVAQYLINHLNVAYINNLTSLFPRSPICANNVFGNWLQDSPGDYEAFYGKSRLLSGANDGLYIWDRWLGSSREIIPDRLVTGSGSGMRQFFGAMEAKYELPMVSKVNKLNTCADLVAEILPNADFLCVMRDPVFLAQSLYIARQKIMGDLNSAYGVQHHPVSSNPIEDVCLQVIFHEQQVQRQLDLLGPARFSVLSYEKFCKSPHELLTKLTNKYPEMQSRNDKVNTATSFLVSDSQRLPEEILEYMRARLNELGAGRFKGYAI